jgi:hypothetical protein
MPMTFYLAAASSMAASQVRSQTGNGAPSGPHYNLNIIGGYAFRSPGPVGSLRTFR